MGSFIFLFLLMGVMYAVMIRPQQKRMRAHAALLSSLEVGMVVVTSSGIYGAVAEVEDSVVWLEVAPDVELKVTKASIGEVVSNDDDQTVGDDETETVTGSGED
jgi:preprotein translocase subunit YajC